LSTRVYVAFVIVVLLFSAGRAIYARLDRLERYWRAVVLLAFVKVLSGGSASASGRRAKRDPEAK
jgi:hypothetical protein